MESQSGTSTLPRFVLAAAGTAASVYIVSRVFSPPKEGVPPTAPGGILESLKNIGGKDAPSYLLKMTKACQSTIFQLNVPVPGGFFVIGDYQAQREILTKSDEKPLEVYSSFNNISGKASLFTRETKDSIWKVSRKGIAPAFSTREVNRMSDVCKKHLETWMNGRLAEFVKNEQAFDPADELLNLTFNIILESAFEYNCSQEEYEHVTHEIELGLREFGWKHATNPFRKFYARFLEEGRRAYLAGENVRNFARKILLAYRSNPNKSSEKTIVNLIEGIEGYCDDQKISEMIAFLIGGHDTTGYTLSTFLVFMAKHPEIAEKARLSQLASGDDDKPSDFVQYCMKESNRMVPVAATGSVRKAERAFVFPVGFREFHIPKGAILFMPQMIPNYDPMVYTEPDRFQPERWENATEEMKQSMLMFSLGKRNCIGQSLAMAELQTVIPKLLTKFKFELETEGELDYFLTLKFAGARIKAKAVEVSLDL